MKAIEWKTLAQQNEEKIRTAICTAIVEAATTSNSGYQNKVYLWPDGDVTSDWAQSNTWPANDHRLVAAVADYDCRDNVDSAEYEQGEQGLTDAGIAKLVDDYRDFLRHDSDTSDEIDRLRDEFIQDLDSDAAYEG